MKLSGFAMVRNASKYYFPIKESIESVLPIVDEFIVALGNSDADDNTEELIRSIQSPKIKIFPRVWDEKLFYDGEIFRQETNFALQQCSGDWCIYLQADEVVHEDDHAEIVHQCQKYLDDKKVQGMLFKYLHFWGDYDHHIYAHSWYEAEIRIVRNHIGITSYKDAQSFRIDNQKKLNVIQTKARIFHYGWVRPPYVMQSKRKEQNSMHFGKKKAVEDYAAKAAQFEYGPLGRLSVYKGTHPASMHELIQKHHWKDKLDYGKKLRVTREKISHENSKYRILSFIENKLLFGRKIFGYRNWNILKEAER
jgi:glycosyltransferase involved in cell wall biosynthesis